MEIMSAMRLEKYYVTMLNIVMNSSAVSAVLAKDEEFSYIEDEKVELTLLHAFKTHVSGLRFWVSLVVDVSWPSESSSRFKDIRVVVDGFFSFSDGTESETIQQYVPVLCLTNLVGIARGVISQATAFCPGGAYVLPLLDINKMLQLTTDNDVTLAKVGLDRKPKPKRAKNAVKRASKAVRIRRGDETV